MITDKQCYKCQGRIKVYVGGCGSIDTPGSEIQIIKISACAMAYSQ